MIPSFPSPFSLPLPSPPSPSPAPSPSLAPSLPPSPLPRPEQTLHALNEGNIPTAGSVVDAFNRAVVDRCMALYNEKVGSPHLIQPLFLSPRDSPHGGCFAAFSCIFLLFSMGFLHSPYT